MSGAARTHLGAGDLPVAVARSVAGPDHLLGGTARTATSALALVQAGADYLEVGPAYPTTTKTGLPAALGPAGGAGVASAGDVPVIAIGGITLAHISPLMAAGAASPWRNLSTSSGHVLDGFTELLVVGGRAG